MTRAARALAVAALTATALTGCGGEDERAAAPAPAERTAQPVGRSSGGSVAQFASCADWKAGTREQRLATVAELRGQLTPQRSTTAASPLPDTEAYDVFQRACRPAYADSLRLYKLYVKVQGFAPLRD